MKNLGDLKNEYFSKSIHFLISIPKSTKSVSETPPIHYGPHDKLVELAEICRLRYSNVKSDDRNMVTFGKRKLKFRKTASSNVEIWKSKMPNFPVWFWPCSRTRISLLIGAIDRTRRDLSIAPFKHEIRVREHSQIWKNFLAKFVKIAKKEKRLNFLLGHFWAL